MNKKIAFTTLGFVVSIFVVSIFVVSSSRSADKEKLNIVTTFYPVYEFTKSVAGDVANVKLLIGEGLEVHDYELSSKSAAFIQEADVFVYENENMETWVPKLIDMLDIEKIKVVKATEGMFLLPGVEEEKDNYGKGCDPHLWLSPKRAIDLVENIRDSLSEEFPDYKKTFHRSARHYILKLKALDKKYETAFASAKKKVFVTQHNAFAYLALDYGLTQVPISDLTPNSDPSAARLVEIARYIKKKNIKYIFFDGNSSQSLAETLARETGIKISMLNSVESLTEAELKDGRTYISVMEANLLALEKITK